MCYLNFNTKEKYIAFLDRLVSFCDLVAILKEDDEDVHSDFIEKIKPFVLEEKWTRKFPTSLGGGKVKKYPLSKEVVLAFKEYDSFLTVGYDFDTELGLDMAFYRNRKLVFLVERHEDMCDLSCEYEAFFKDVIQKYHIGSMDY